ncbi:MULTISPECIES: hypothetical protein [unclassified Colwellia]|uniref:hypothetical protein n=1 Tax=unclassified Colwellia TaxID=196834 RepID=UPI0015F4CB2B|nr:MULTISPECIES: hypothetical protein [unclassified Colwellia]MBA6258150.1 hypothetical protein [Colwellia sp. MB3u-28]MBA6259577.1 hypothetical protein [Colwellia sp. MB3u-41]
MDQYPGTGYVGVAEVISDIRRADKYQLRDFNNKTLNELTTQEIIQLLRVS